MSVTFNIDEETLSPDDKPAYSLHSETNLTLKPADAFAFGADVHPGYFQAKLDNTSGSAKKLGHGATGSVRITISWPNSPWSKVIYEDASIGTMMHRSYSQTFCIRTPARLEILLKHNGCNQPPMFKNFHCAVQINSCLPAEALCIMNLGVQPTAGVILCMHATCWPIEHASIAGR